MSTNIVKNEGSYTLLSMTMSMGNKALDLSPYVAKCDIYESILSPSVIAEIIVSDATGIFSSALLTEEEVCISFTTHDESNPTHYRLKILDVNPVLRMQNDKSVSYVLTCLNDEVIKSKTITSPLVRQKIVCENIVAYLLDKELDSEKDLFLEKTKGLHSFTITEMSPMDGIEKARDIAISEKY